MLAYGACIVGIIWLMMRVVVRQKRGPATECAWCGYSLVDIEEPVCPECGGKRKLAKPRDRPRTVLRVLAIAAFASFVSIHASAYGPRVIVTERSAIVALYNMAHPHITVTGTTTRWFWPPPEDRPDFEPDRVVFGYESRQVELMRDPNGSGWLEFRTETPVDATDLATTLGAPEFEKGLAEVLSQSWIDGPIASLMNDDVETTQRSSFPARGEPEAWVSGRRSRSAQTLLPTYGLIAVVWVFAGWRIWSLFR